MGEALKRILVVEDQRLIAVDLETTLEALGYAVAGSASSGEEALQKAESLRPDLVLMDIRLRGEMDGIEAAMILRERFDLPVVYLTAYADEETVRRAKATTPYGYVVKPFTERDLRSAVEIALYKHEIERRIKERERWLRTTLRSTLDAVVTVDEGGAVNFVNRAATELTGWSESDAARRPLAEVCHVTDAAGRLLDDDLLGPEIRSLSRTFPEDARLVTRDGRFVPVDGGVTAIVDEKGAARGKVVVLRDATPRRRVEEARLRIAEEETRRAGAEAERRRSELLARFGTALAASLDEEIILREIATLPIPMLADACLILTENAAGGLSQVVEAARDPATLDAMRSLRSIELPAPVVDMVQGVLRTGSAGHFGDYAAWLGAESTPSHAYLDTVRPCAPSSAIIVPLAARPPGTSALFLFARDHEREEGDVALAVAMGQRAGLALDNARLYREAHEAIQARDDFIAIASHELRTPLTPLQLQLEVLTRALHHSADENTRLAVRFDAATRRTARLAILIESLLDVSQIRSGSLKLLVEEFDFAEMIREVAGRHAAQARAAGCQLSITAASPLVGRWDRLRAEEIVENLLSNALKFGAGKPVEVEVRPDNGGVRLSVRDHGIGIPPAAMEHIFDRFHRAVSTEHYGGFGIGLYLSRRIVEAHGGTIAVDSRLGAGATFTVTLPSTAGA